MVGDYETHPNSEPSLLSHSLRSILIISGRTFELSAAISIYEPCSHSKVRGKSIFPP